MTTASVLGFVLGVTAGAALAASSDTDFDRHDDERADTDSHHTIQTGQHL
jgi:hypothetical protein